MVGSDMALMQELSRAYHGGLCCVFSLCSGNKPCMCVFRSIPRMVPVHSARKTMERQVFTQELFICYCTRYRYRTDPRVLSLSGE